MPTALYIFITFTIFPATVLALLRLKMILSVDRLIVWLCVLYSLTELLSFILVRTVRNNIPLYGIYEIFDALLCTQLLFNWGCFRNQKWVFRLIQGMLVLAWIGFHLGSPGFLLKDRPQFRILYSSVIIFMGIDRINAFVLAERQHLFRNGRFICCMGLVVYGIFESLQDTLLALYPYPYSSLAFGYHLFDITAIVMLAFNIAMIFAILRLPTRERFVLPRD